MVYNKIENISKIENALSQIYNISILDINSRIKKEEIVEIRMIIWYICHKYLDISSVKLGKYYKRDHSTILNGIKKMENKEDIIGFMYSKIKEIFPEIFD